MNPTDDNNTEGLLKERFAELPPAIQRAITDARVETHLRTLAQKHKLHLDRWVVLENQIMLVLLGLEKPQNMVGNIVKEVGVDADTAQSIVNDIVAQVFQPIREQMRQQLDKSGREAHADREATDTPSEAPTVSRESGEGVESTPDTLHTHMEKKRPSDSVVYKPGESSTSRRDVDEDPYRESIE